MLPAIIRLQVFLHYWSFCCLYFWSNLWPFCIALNFLCPVVPTLLSSPILSATVSTQLWNAGRRVRRESMEWACVLFRIGRIELDGNIPKCRVLSSEMFVRNGGGEGGLRNALNAKFADLVVNFTAHTLCRALTFIWRFTAGVLTLV